MTDPFAAFKVAQKQGWALFAPLEIATTLPAAELVHFAGISPGARLLDVATGTGVVAVTAARLGANVSALDLSPKLLERAGENARLARVAIAFEEGDVEALPYPDASFDIVVSQFGHMFAPRPEVAIGEMLRVLRPGGRIAFSTWPPEHFVGRMFALVSRYVPPPEGASPPPKWGSPDFVREKLGDAVESIEFDRGVLTFPTLSPAHYREGIERTLAPVAKLVETTTDTAKLERFRAELEAMVASHLERNGVRQHYLMTRATKRRT